MPSSLGRIGSLQYGETSLNRERIGGRLYVCNGREPMHVYEPGRAVWRQAGMMVPPDDLIDVDVAAQGSPGLTGTYNVCATEYDADANIESNPTARTEVSPAGQAIEVTITGSFIKNPTTTHIRLYRTIDDGAYPTMFWMVELARDTIGATYVYYDDLDDTTLQDSDKALIVTHGVPPVMAFPIYCKRRLFMWGDGVYDRGTLQVTNGSRAVLGNGMNGWNRGIEGHRIIFGTHADEYEVLTFSDGSPQELALVDYMPAYAGPTDTEIAYRTYRPPGRLRWSSQDGYEYFPSANERHIAKGRPMVPTGGAAFHGRLMLFFAAETYMLQFDADPSEGRGTEQRLSGNHGCIAHRTIQQITSNGQQRLVWLARHGIASTAGSGVDLASDQPGYPGGMRAFFDDLLLTPGGYNQMACAVNLPSKGLYLCAVPTVDGNGGCDKVVVWDYVKNNFWVWEFPFEIYDMKADWEYLDGGQRREVVRMGTDDGLIATWPSGETDMAERNRGDAESPAAGDLSGTVTSAGSDWLEDTDATFITQFASPAEKLGLAGAYVSVEDSDGDIQRRRIVSNTDHRVTTETAWTTTPSVSDSYWIGEIQSYYQVPQIDFNTVAQLKHINEMHLFYEVEEQGTLYFDFYAEAGSDVETMSHGSALDLTGESHPVYGTRVPKAGMHKVPINIRSYRFGWRVRNRKPNEPWALNRISFPFAPSRE